MVGGKEAKKKLEDRAAFQFSVMNLSWWFMWLCQRDSIHFE